MSKSTILVLFSSSLLILLAGIFYYSRIGRKWITPGLFDGVIKQAYDHVKE